LQKILEERFPAPVRLGNDANLAALAEWRYGAGQGHHDLLYLTISTGIGSGVIVKDQLMVGAHGLAAELGHTTIQADGGPLCSCGQYGHLESLASGTAMLRWVEEQLAAGRISRLSGQPALSGKMIAQAAEAGDELAIAALTRLGTYMGIALASFLHTFNPSVVVLGGGVSQSKKFFIGPLRAALESSVMAPEYLNDLKIEAASFGDESGLIGALALARDLFPPEHGL
jgi:glucokinase